MLAAAAPHTTGRPGTALPGSSWACYRHEQPPPPPSSQRCSQGWATAVACVSPCREAAAPDPGQGPARPQLPAGRLPSPRDAPRDAPGSCQPKLGAASGPHRSCGSSQQTLQSPGRARVTPGDPVLLPWVPACAWVPCAKRWRFCFPRL